MPSGVPEEWRIPIAFAVLWVVPLIVAVARPSFWARTHGHAEPFVVLALFVVLVVALLQQSRFAWWTLVVIYVVGGLPSWIQQIVSGGLSIGWTIWAVLALAQLALLLSTPMRRVVGVRGRLSADPRTLREQRLSPEPRPEAKTGGAGLAAGSPAPRRAPQAPAAAGNEVSAQSCTESDHCARGRARGDAGPGGTDSDIAAALGRAALRSHRS